MIPLDINELAVQVGSWSRKNFGGQESWKPLLGMIEEVGELAEVVHLKNKDEEVADALGDIMIYMADYLHRSEIMIDPQLTKIENRDKTRPGPNLIPDVMNALFVHVGRISHSHLKLAQNIRQNEEHDVVRRRSLGRLVANLRFLAQHKGMSLDKVTRETWQKVSKRDWTPETKVS